MTFIDTEMRRIGVEFCWHPRVTNFDQATPLMMLLFERTRSLMR